MPVVEFTLDRFHETGVVHLPGAMTVDQAAAIRNTIWRFIEAHTEIAEGDPSSWRGRSPSISFKSLQGRAVFAPLVENAALTAATQAIFEPHGPEPPRRRGRVLWTFPQRDPWLLPTSWHMDGNFGLAAFPVPGVQLWALLADVEPCGGGTLLLAGSHHLVERYAARLPADQRGGNSVSWSRMLKQDPWLDQVRRGGTPENPRRDLLGDAHEVDGATVTPIEITGRAGDMFVSHIQVFHSPSPNTASKVRQMLTGGIGGRSRAELPLP